MLVQQDEDNPTGVSISTESPMQATVVYQPGNRRKRLAGYKRYREPGENAATEWLLTADEVATWPPRADRRRPIIEPNPTGVIGMIPIVPQPRTLGPGRSELLSAVSFQDRINTTIFNRMVAGDFGAYRQVWATGIKLMREVVKTEEGGEVTKVQAPFQMGANRLLTNESPEGRFGSLPPTDLRGYLDSAEQDVTMLAAATQTPMHYLTGQLVNLSADAIRAAEAGLVAKVRRRSLHIGEAWEETIRTAFTLTGRPGATDVSAETQWPTPRPAALASWWTAWSRCGRWACRWKRCGSGTAPRKPKSRDGAAWPPANSNRRWPRSPRCRSSGPVRCVKEDSYRDHTASATSAASTRTASATSARPGAASTAPGTASATGRPGRRGRGAAGVHRGAAAPRGRGAHRRAGPAQATGHASTPTRPSPRPARRARPRPRPSTRGSWPPRSSARRPRASSPTPRPRWPRSTSTRWSKDGAPDSKAIGKLVEQLAVVPPPPGRIARPDARRTEH